MPRHTPYRRLKLVFENGLLPASALASGVVIGTIMSASLALSAVPHQPQDSIAVMQLQQQISSLRLELSNRISSMEIEIDGIERRVVDLQNRLFPLENDLRQLALAPPPAPPGRPASASERVVSMDTPQGSELRLYDGGGNLRVLLTASREGGGITLYDAEGHELFRR